MGMNKNRLEYLLKLNNVSVIETYFKKRRIFKIRDKDKKQRTSYKYKACCICLYDYRNGDQLRKLKCNHYFHQHCIDVWFERKTHCPLCKQSVISAKVLSKKSNPSDISSSTSTNTTSSTSSSTVTTTESEEEKEHVIDVQKEHKYSLSDSHCSYKQTAMTSSTNNKYVSDDSSLSTTTRHSTANHLVARHRKNYSQSHSFQSQSAQNSLNGEVVNNHVINQNDSNNMNPFSVTATTTSTNDISLSSSPTNYNSQYTEDYKSSFAV